MQLLDKMREKESKEEGRILAAFVVGGSVMNRRIESSWWCRSMCEFVFLEREKLKEKEVLM